MRIAALAFASLLPVSALAQPFAESRGFSRSFMQCDLPPEDAPCRDEAKQNFCARYEALPDAVQQAIDLQLHCRFLKHESPACANDAPPRPTLQKYWNSETEMYALLFFADDYRKATDACGDAPPADLPPLPSGKEEPLAEWAQEEEEIEIETPLPDLSQEARPILPEPEERPLPPLERAREIPQAPPVRGQENGPHAYEPEELY